MKIIQPCIVCISCCVFLSQAIAQTAGSQEKDPFDELNQAIEKNYSTKPPTSSPAPHTESVQPAQATQVTQATEFSASSQLNEFKQWQDNYLSQYQQYRKAYFSALDDRRDQLLKQWGDAELSNKSQFVKYQKGTNGNAEKVVYDFANNEVRLSWLSNEEQSITTGQIKQSLQQLSKDADNKQVVASILKQESDYHSADKLLFEQYLKEGKLSETTNRFHQNKRYIYEKESEKVRGQMLAQQQALDKLYDQLIQPTPKNNRPSKTLDSTHDNTPDYNHNYKKAQRSVDAAQQKQLQVKIHQEKIQIKREQTERLTRLVNNIKQLPSPKSQQQASNNQKITTVTIPLAKSSELAKAQPFVAQVKEQSQRWQLPPSFVLAIMHTESYFNPKAQSHIPAFGLMQIVPNSAGTDVNRFLFNKDKPMTSRYLFQPNENIEAGIAYLHLLDERYLGAIKNNQSRLYCMIAAYNTGSGNLARSFNKNRSRSVSQAVPIINAMQPEEVYQYLLNNLPYQETRHYLQRVVAREKLYQVVGS